MRKECGGVFAAVFFGLIGILSSTVTAHAFSLSLPNFLTRNPFVPSIESHFVGGRGPESLGGPSGGPPPGGSLPAAKCGQNSDPLAAGGGQDLEVTGGVCTVGAGTYNYRNVNVYNGGTLYFKDEAIDFYAASILVENKGAVIAGMDPTLTTIVPIGTAALAAKASNTGVLKIHLWGADQGRHGIGITCKTDAMCGVPEDIWSKGASAKQVLNPGTPGEVTDYFYSYDPLPYDDGADPNNGDRKGFFGYKVLAVSYGGTLKLYGLKGASYGSGADTPSNTGSSWVRLSSSLIGSTSSSGAGGDSTFTVNNPVDWQPGDDIVVTSTDYMPGHAEALNIKSITGGDNITVTSGVTYNHNGVQFPLSTPDGIGPTNPDGTKMTAMENRAGVALLSRSIVIQSEGAKGNDPTALPAAFGPTDYFGGHTVVRQGVLAYQVQGVEFKQLGQGGRLAHYPVHFHMLRQAPPQTFVKDCSVNESMTRWYVLHATQNITLQRDVGYLSIGHGYYLEEGTETDNRLYANIGIFARGAVDNAQNPRKVPGILASPDYPVIQRTPANGGPLQTGPSDDVVPYHSDWDHPTVFWLMNGWNDLEYNMAAGAGTCGVCYWMLPGGISGMSRMMNWESYASEQTAATSQSPGREGTTPVETFLGNSCSTAMASFVTVANTTACNGVQIGPNRINPVFPVLNPIANDLAPKTSATMPDENGLDADNFYPKLGGGGRFPTKCAATGTCANTPMCSPGNEANCFITALDQYTTSFNWAETNFAAVWLRPQWYLFINSIISDPQNGGITFVTGGGYTDSDVVPGHWALARKDAFIGNTQDPQSGGKLPSWNPYSSNAGPFNPYTKLKCDPQYAGNYCLSKTDGVSFPAGNLADNQRLFSIYDGPSYEDRNAFLEVHRTDLSNDIHGCTADTNPNSKDDNHNCGQSDWSAALIGGMPYDSNKGVCYLPNAAIAWKQPNGFFYPPAFHSDNLFFNNVDIRHFVIEPTFYDPSTAIPSVMSVKNACSRDTTGRYSVLQPDNTCCPINMHKAGGFCVPNFLFQTDQFAAQKRYCTYNATMFDNFTDIDRQTELSDDDGSLTGLIDTISVNQDHFFNAPVETPECLSDVDVTPAANPTLYPGTAVTSPYDYVSTVVFPKCADSTHKNAVCGVNWAQNCSVPNCYGVPLYRENLLPTETKAPVIRLMGQNAFQRSSLTTNNNTYLVDTSPSFSAQQTRYQAITFYNVFEANQTYYLFQLFAKPTTSQTYDIFVGKNDSKFQATNCPNDPTVTTCAVPSGSPFFMSKVGLQTAQYQFTDQLSGNAQTWPSTWAHHYDAGTGILRVSMNMVNYADFQTNYSAERQNKCKPASFCQWDSSMDKPGGNPCQCVTASTDPNQPGNNLPFPSVVANECTAENSKICSWAIADTTCPSGGCYALGLTMSPNFVTSNEPPNPPAPTRCFKMTDTGFNIPFDPITNKTDACYYQSPPTGQFCP